MKGHDGNGEARLRNRALHRYIAAMDRGDVEGVAAILEMALDDPELDGMISEVNEAYEEEEGLTPTARDAELVRDLIHKHFASAFEGGETETAPLEVRQVANRLERDPRVPSADRVANSSLRGVSVPLPRRLDRRGMERLKRDLGVEASERFWRRFKDTAVVMEIGRADSLGRLAAREERERRGARKGGDGGRGHPDRERRAVELDASGDGSNESVATWIETAYRAAGLEDIQTDIAPLYDLISAYPLSIREVKGLTYEGAAKELSSLTGRTIAFSDERQHDKSLAGFLYTQGYHGCVLVKGDDPVGRRRFSAAHELGHYVRHFLPLLERQEEDASREVLILVEGLSYSEDEDTAEVMPDGLPKLTRAAEDLSLAGDVERMEREANEFAAELLMPAPVCKRLVEEYEPDYGRRLSVLSRLLAGELLVSQGAMKRRLRELGLADG
jgi:Zn-dependent peptidase ImmA (M78 family)